MTDLEKKFSKEWMKKAEEAQGMEGYNATRLLKNIEEHGGVSVARRALSRDGCSENFEILKKKNRLDLSMEALIVKGEYGVLFDDNEVNDALALLCDCGYFG
ncbi:hypothetical protein [Anaerotignum sp. MB30-C6]|uniref:hypothetical protein n=1 Tax=Anaerotignum sp. MB30-C6 TaxID=3070814 RepID=UPI0027DCA99D|nr:hypothetical protein [Anaerotignum sp. MB30-C6]WMI82170.1 hypothetical protein RBQ60_05390 [Anaerotignum sp. MB30-C6]